MPSTRARGPIVELADIDADRVAAWLGIEASAVLQVSTDEVALDGHAGRSSRLARVAVRHLCSARETQTRLFVKWAKPDSPAPTLRACLQEVRLLARPDFPSAHANDPFVRCYDVCATEQLGRWHVVEEDLETTHRCPEWAVSLTEAEAKQAAVALARLHARFWDDPVAHGWFSSGGRVEVNSAELFQRRLATHQCAPKGELGEVSDALSERLPAARAQEIDALAHALPRLVRERASRRPPGQAALTLLHGDPHPQNFMLPRESSRSAKLVDWQGSWLGIPTLDLAYLGLTCWTPDERRAHETGWLARYHEELLLAGVDDYSVEEYRHDYRLAIACLIVAPYNVRRAGAPETLWGTLLDRWLVAYDDLGVRDILRDARGR